VHNGLDLFLFDAWTVEHPKLFSSDVDPALLRSHHLEKEKIETIVHCWRISLNCRSRVLRIKSQFILARSLAVSEDRGL
jgi:hypothetical protein